MTKFPSMQVRSDGKSSEVATTVNGVDLNTLAYNFTTRSGMHTTAGLRGANPVTPGKDGSTYRPGKKRDENELNWKMWASPVTDLGVIPSSPTVAYTNWRANMDKLLALFDSSTSLLWIVQNGRECYADVLDAIDPEVAYGNVGAFEVSLRVPDAFWRDTADRTYTSVTGTGAIKLHTMSEFAGATAPMADLTYTVSGPVTNPRVTDELTGHYVEYIGTIASGSSWVVNAEAYTSMSGASNLTANTNSSGVYAPSLLTLTHRVDPTAAIQVRLGGTAAGTNTRLQVVGRRKYK